MSDSRQYAPATERNRQPILAVLQQVLPKAGTVLEISSGTGEHITYFASRLRYLQWIASEPQAVMRDSIQSWAAAIPTDNLYLPPLDLNVSDYPWPVEKELAENESLGPITAIVNINMIHISAWEMCRHLMAGAQRILPTGGVLYLYGPYKRDGEHTAPSNEAFDRVLRDRNPEWGIRDLEAVTAVAQQHSLVLEQVIPMPANNFSVVFRRDSTN
ncbi:MAG: DUF938 domain-containing protein [Phormidesmis sp.]